MVQDVKKLNHVGASEDYIYLVEPIGNVTKANLGWFTDLLYLAHENSPDNKLALKYIENYFSGKPYNGKNGWANHWEFLAPAVKILKQIK